MEPNEVHARRGYRTDNLDGGVQAWAQAGLPVRTPHGEQPGEVA